ncbi:TetR family transcriptional regulator [candidate division KSB1 bacterium]|nr:TetR family transcriptional regulator [candidate division KSB1 bacterium]
MKEPTPRQKEIVNVAIRLIAGKGMPYLTIKHIAEEIGISEPAIYRHFDSKHDILMAVLGHFETVSLRIRDQLQRQNGNGLEQIRRFMFDRYALFSDNPDLAKVLFAEEMFMNDEQLAKKILGIMHQHRDLLFNAIQKGQKEKEIRSDIDADHLFHFIVGSMRLLVNRWSFSGFAFDLKHEGSTLWQAVEIMIKPD